MTIIYYNSNVKFKMLNIRGLYDQLSEHFVT